MAKIDEHREYVGTVIENLDPDRAGSKLQRSWMA